MLAVEVLKLRRSGEEEGSERSRAGVGLAGQAGHLAGPLEQTRHIVMETNFLTSLLLGQ